MMSISDERMKSLLAYCRVEEPTEVGYLENAGVSEPPAGTSRRAQYDLAVNFLVLRDFDLRDATITGTIVEDNPAFRRLIVQLKLTEPVSDLDTSGG